MLDSSKKILVRNIDPDSFNALEVLAKKNERSTEAEARFAIKHWVLAFQQANERSARRLEVAARLQELLRNVNEARHGKPLRPSHVAQAIGEDCAEDVEKWFTGEKEPSFDKLAAIAGYLGGVAEWLQHSDRQMFPTESTRIPEDAGEGVSWLLDLNGSLKLHYLYLVRDLSDTGSFAVVKQYGEWQCKTFTTPYHVSEEIGAGGESSLAHLSLIWQLLYKCYTTASSETPPIKSYLLHKDDFLAMCAGKVHPLTALRNGRDAPWWEDFWDSSQFPKQSYWPGWKSVCERIRRVVELKERLLEQRNRIESGEHPLLKHDLRAHGSSPSTSVEADGCSSS